MSFIKFCLLVAACWLQSQLLGSNAKTRPIDWKIFDSILLADSCVEIFLYFQLSILPQRDRGWRRDWDITDSGDGQVLGAGRWRSWETETTGTHTKVRARVNWTGWVVLFNIYILTIDHYIYILIIDHWLHNSPFIIDSHYPCFRQARGFSLLEQKSTHWKSGICPYNSTTGPLLIERLDLGSTYYKNFFYGKGESTSLRSSQLAFIVSSAIMMRFEV